MNTLQGIRRDIPVRVEALDFDYNYRHEDPFPWSNGLRNIDQAFRNVFDLRRRFLQVSRTGFARMLSGFPSALAMVYSAFSQCFRPGVKLIPKKKVVPGMV